MKRGAALPTGHGDLAASLVVIFPLLLAYEIGVLFAGTVNGADVVTRAIYALCGGRTGYLVLHAVLALAFLVWIRRARAWGALRMEVVAPVALEAACYAFALGAVVRLIVDHATPAEPESLHLGRWLGLGAADSVVSALGAGVHEELVFRLGLMSALVAVIGRGRGAMPLALAGSAVLFALAHHIGPHGEPLTLHALAFRTLAGAAFGAIYWYRSLAHAVYAHVLYDLAVTLVA